MNEELIYKTLSFIQEQTGLSLERDDYFSNVRCNLLGLYFNVKTKDPLYCSKEYDILKRYAKTYKTIYVQPNGYKRLAIYPLTTIVKCSTTTTLTN